MARRMHVGLDGFADPGLTELLYGRDVPAERRLRTYADTFDAYEVSFTRYPEFTREHAEALLQQAPPGLRLLPRLGDHVLEDPERLGEWLDAAGPILHSHDCGPVYVPWPERWSPASERRLALLLDRLWTRLPARGRIAVEFGHASWFRGDCLRLLEEHAVGLVWSTKAGMVPYKVTSDFLYVRLTGNHPNRRDEVTQLLERLRARAGDERPIHLIGAQGYDQRALEAVQRIASSLGRPLHVRRRMEAGQSTLAGFGAPSPGTGLRPSWDGTGPAVPVA